MFGIGLVELLFLGAAAFVVIIIPIVTVVVLVTRGRAKRDDRE